jgi:hypothetical protein
MLTTGQCNPSNNISLIDWDAAAYVVLSNPQLVFTKEIIFLFSKKRLTETNSDFNCVSALIWTWV